tara:strand:- start:644 stop:1825 length:1182 start_codon:yes stop_codon:yes gene_type:complete
MRLLDRDMSQSGRQMMPITADDLLSTEEKKHVFIFPGKNTLDVVNFSVAGGYVKMIERLLGGQQCYGQDLMIHCVTYSELTPDMEKAGLFQRPETHATADARQFAQHYLLPLLCENAGQLDPEVQTLPVLQERMRHITFVGHSYGSMFLQEIANVLAQRMELAGYSAEDTKALLREGVGLAIASTAPMTPGVPRFRTVTANSYEDQTSRHLLEDVARTLAPPRDSSSMSAHALQARQDGIEKQTQHLLHQCGYGRDYYPHLKIKPVANGVLLVDRLPTYKHWSDYQNSEVQGRELSEQTAKANHMDVRHDIRNHLIPDEGHNIYPSILGRVFRNAVHREAGQGMDSLLFTHRSESELPPYSDFRPYVELPSEQLDAAIHRALKQKTTTMSRGR